MKKITILFCIVFTVATVRAQYASIPDTAFGNWLNTNGYSSCITGNSTTGWNLDTTCSAVLNATSMTIQNVAGVKNLQGIQYFKGLTYLNLNNNALLASLTAFPPALVTLNCVSNALLIAIPALPATLQILNCGPGHLYNLPALPASLTYLNCYNNNLSSLPALPASLVYLSCFNNNIGFIPALPATLNYLNCSSNNIGSLPLLNEGLDTLICGGNGLASMSALPKSLTYLNCAYLNYIHGLPALDSSLSYLDCSGDNLSTGLPALPASLANLICSGTHITSLPALPALLTYLDCSGNSLTSIPALPDSLSWFDCSANPDLTCLPYLNAVVHFNFSSTGITCIPDHPADNNYMNPTVPVCTAGDACYTGINQAAAERFNVYPNPASNHLTVESSGEINQVTLSNMLGQRAYSITGNNKTVMNLDVSSVQPGVYIIEAYCATGVNTAKIIVGN